MKTHFHISKNRRQRLGFTLAEVTIASSIFLLMSTGLIYTFLFGLHLHETVAIKLGANDAARKALIKLTDEVRSATRVKIGSGDPTTFVEAGTNKSRPGHPYRSFLTARPTTGSATILKRTRHPPIFPSCAARHPPALTVPPLWLPKASRIWEAFSRAEDSYGNLLGNDQNNRVIGVTLQFYQIEYPIVKIGPGNYYDYYQLHTRITRRRLF